MNTQRLAWQQFCVDLPAEAEPIVSSGNYRKGRIVFADPESTLEVAWKASRTTSVSKRHAPSWDEKSQSAFSLVQFERRTFALGVRGTKDLAESKLEAMVASLEDKSHSLSSEWAFLQLHFKSSTPCDAVRWERKAGHTRLELLANGHVIVATCSALWSLESEFSDKRTYFDAYAESMGRTLDWTNPDRPRTPFGVKPTAKAPAILGAVHEDWVHMLHFWYGGLWRKEPVLDLDFLF